MRPMNVRTRRGAGVILGVVAACTAPPPAPQGEAKVEVATPVENVPDTPPVVTPPETKVARPEIKPALVGYHPRPWTIATTSDHACALAGAGEVWCWGDGDFGEVEPGTAGIRSTPVRVAGLERAVAVMVSDNLSCALGADGAVQCWGRVRSRRETVKLAAGTLGQVAELALFGGGVLSKTPPWVCARRGDGTVACSELTAPTNPAVVVEGLTDAVALVSREDEVHVVRAGGGLAWFKPFTDEAKPTAVSGLGEVVDIASSEFQVCVKTRAGQVHCRHGAPTWDERTAVSGPLWKRWLSTELEPTKELVASAVDASESILLKCIRDLAGEVQCWGQNEGGQLALGEPSFSPEPREVLTGTGLAAGGDRSCALQDGGTIACFDHANAKVPVEGVRALALGTYHTCAIVGAGEARCWGMNEYGVLGVPEGDEIPDEPEDAPPKPAESGLPTDMVRVPGLTDLAFIAVGEEHTCAAGRDHKVYCWGLGDVGQLGDGKADDPDKDVEKPHARAKPTVVAGIEGEIRGLALAGKASCAWTDADLWCWGLMVNPSTDEDARFTRPRKVLKGPIRDVDGEDMSLCALGGAGVVHCMGEPAQQYRDGEFVRFVERGEKADPNRFPGGGPLWSLGDLGLKPKAVAAGLTFACVLSEADEVWCWGTNAEGQLGDGTTETRSEPGKVVGLPGPAVQIAAGSNHACARMADGAIFCWGSKTGPMAYAETTTPRKIAGLAPYVVAAAGQ